MGAETRGQSSHASSREEHRAARSLVRPPSAPSAWARSRMRLLLFCQRHRWHVSWRGPLRSAGDEEPKIREETPCFPLSLRTHRPTITGLPHSAGHATWAGDTGKRGSCAREAARPERAMRSSATSPDTSLVLFAFGLL